MLLVIGCQVETPIRVAPEVAVDFEACVRCLEDSPPQIDEDPTFDTVVVTLYELGAELDCSSCVERGLCEVADRACVCMAGPQPLSTLDIETLLDPLTFENVSRNSEYCVSVATLSAGGAPGPACQCEPREWVLPEVSRPGLSCTYSRRAKNPGDDSLELNQTVCHNPVSGFTLPPPMGGEEVRCVFADFFNEAIRRCMGLAG